ncbi:hypothetical protein B4U79_16059, partial [Dinothrombium tinctorium]
MVYSVAFVPISMKEKIQDMEFADSKTLTEEKRSEIFDKINVDTRMGWITEILSPVTISNSMLRRSKYNLNALSHDTAMALISKVIENGFGIKEVYIDTVGVPEKYKAKIAEKFPQISKITVAKKADSLYPIVSAASICAKVIRDTVVSKWNFVENITNIKETEYGSGYPSDPVTKDFLKTSFDKVFGFPTFVRFSWSTVTLILDEKGVECEWEEDNEEKKPESKGCRSILDFYQTKRENSPKAKKQKTHSFFNDRCLQRIDSLL